MYDILKNIKVIDLGAGQAVSKAGLLLAQAGARVEKIEDISLPGVLSDVEHALWNRDKIKHVLNFSDGSGQTALHELLADADILIHDRLPKEAKRLNLDGDYLTRIYPNLIHVAVGAWPAGHPREEVPVDDLLALAGAGILDEQEPVDRSGPVYLRFPLGSNHAFLLTAIGALARLYARRRTGRGGSVRTSLVQGALVPMMMHWARAENPSPSVAAGIPKYNSVTLFECADGLWFHSMGEVAKVPKVQAALVAMDPAERQRLNSLYDRDIVTLTPDRGACDAVFRTRPREEWLQAIWAADLPAQPVTETGKLLEDEQAIANNFVEDVDDSNFGRIRQPGIPFQLDFDGNGDGQDEAEIHKEMKAPLAGIKVLDCGNFLAGPLGAMILGDLGADVIKLEAVSGDPMRFIEWAFNGCQRNKRAIAVQLKHSDSRPVLDGLIGWADIIHHNLRLPAAGRLGLSRDDVKKVNPKAIYCHISSYGRHGPRKDWPGYDQLFQAVSGWELENAGEGNNPTWLRFGMMDHICALTSVFATLLGLLDRDKSGKGGAVYSSLLGACLSTLESFRLADGAMTPMDRLDKEQLGVSPIRRLYQCSDGWIAVAGAWDRATVEVQNIFSDVKVVEQKLLVGTLVEAKVFFDQWDIPTEPVVLSNREAFLDNEDHKAAGLVSKFNHPEYGKFELPGSFWDFGDMTVKFNHGPPMLGEHTREILSQQGYAADEIESLIADNVIGV